ncbi:pyruvate dehydrogenase E2 component (dihydrolipoamide acetyltransferase) [Tibeticola sediminis]|uniref:Acetyltransferase component of pyruvate dehydrogenase complex n=1 Tax=Tibeticola sediminis TaxID=1917811 RepID=A0A3N4UJL3_9BURK|nr:dihydrolipoyllysine-residue acetyltransferase [Tibeticola sediminis]RPE70643.1 pyruvate dehydrogenase E2 component (dihydrolipoamide acetyltransferase) [Tibeticola sediminis]
MALVEVKVPDIGDFKDVSVIELLVQPGDTIALDQSLLTVESDKASMEIPSSVAGVVRELRVALGDRVSEGSVIALVETAEGGAAPEPEAAPAIAAPAQQTAAPQAAVAASTPTAAPMPTSAERPVEPLMRAAAPLVAAVAAAPDATRLASLPHASPSVRRFARELGVPLEEVTGTGPKGRITLEDVRNFSRAVMQGQLQTRAQAERFVQAQAASPAVLADLLPWPQVDFAKFGPVERKERPRIKKISGANLHRNWVMIPHVTHHENADVTDLEALRVALNQEHEKQGIKFTMLAFVIKAVVAALQKFPEFNASLDGDALIYKKYFHIGFAADTPNGLVVPVLKDADRKGLVQISQELSQLSAKAREGKLTPAEMSGGCFSISSLGGIGGRYFTPIVNAPEVAILGLTKTFREPVWNGEAFTPRLTLPMSLSYDHRVIDGAAAARFAAYLSQLLGDFRRVLL